MKLTLKPNEQILNYINGKLVPPISGNYFPNIEPATGQVYSQVPDSDSRDADEAVKAAAKAYPEWSETPAEIRSKRMLRLADLIEQNLEDLALAESIDNGKPVSLATRVDIPRAAANIKFFATAILHFESESHAMGKVAFNYTLRQPIGVCCCISPWNLPLYLFTWKIAPAIAAGNTVVAKPSELTPATAYLFSRLCIEAGIPPGVLNIVHGSGPKAGEPLVNHSKVKAISFTGGTRTGQRIAASAAPKFKKLSLELGGKNPNIIFEDCDFEKALETTVLSSFSNQGEICLCGSRVFIQRSIYDRFRDALVDKVKQLKVGDPQDEDTRIGALVSAEHQQKVLSYVELARDEGGTVLTGGEAVQLDGRCEGGFFVKPVVIEGLSSTCRVNQEEIFGPVVTLIPFDTEEEVILMANGTEYGLAATIWTENIRRAHRVAEFIETGIVWINCWMLRDLRTPFGGMKQSGVGREGGWNALRFFTEPKNICVKL